MKKFLLTFIMCLPLTAYCQWTGTDLDNITYRNGKVGIGGAPVDYKFEIINPGSGLEKFFNFRVLDAPGDYLKIENATYADNEFIPGLFGYHGSTNRQALYIVGVTESSKDTGYEPIMVFDSRLSGSAVANRPLFSWESYGNKRMSLSASGHLTLLSNASGNLLSLAATGSTAELRLGLNTDFAWMQSFGSRPLKINELGNDVYFNVGGGNVGIGTADPRGFRLAVNGKIWSQEVNVAMTNPGPDYVFEPDYDLLSLSELETYINQNKHLPEVPSAKDMEAEGLNLKEMNLLLLKKVEELTLHLIKQEKEIENLKRKVNGKN